MQEYPDEFPRQSLNEGFMGGVSTEAVWGIPSAKIVQLSKDCLRNHNKNASEWCFGENPKTNIARGNHKKYHWQSSSSAGRFSELKILRNFEKKILTCY